MGVVVDNAANNFTAIEELTKTLPDDSILSEDTPIHCLCHILNLVVTVCFLLHCSILFLHSVTGHASYVHKEERPCWY